MQHVQQVRAIVGVREGSSYARGQRHLAHFHGFLHHEQVQMANLTVIAKKCSMHDCVSGTVRDVTTMCLRHRHYIT